MELALEKLQSASLLLSLDDVNPSAEQEYSELLLTGGSGENRWFDKVVQISVFENGKAGLLAEHAMMDGTIMVDFVDFISKQKFGEDSEHSVSCPTKSCNVVDIFEEALQSLNQRFVETICHQGIVSDLRAAQIH